MYTLAHVLDRLARRLGVEIYTNTPVERVLVRNGTAHGVALAGGKSMDAHAVIINADPRYTYQVLLPEQRRTAARLAQLEPSCSGFILLLGINRTYPSLAHHNIFFSADYQREFKAIFGKRVPAPDPTVYVCTTSLSDPTHAPPGHTNLFVLVNAPALDKRVDWVREAAGYRDTIIRKLERMGLTRLEHHITYERIIAPDDFQARYNATDGAIYGLASNTPWAAFLRPPLRARDLQRLYFVGGGTHPGGGIPLVLLSGQAVAARVLADLGSA